MTEHTSISDKSRRVARNTVLLYLRMLLLMFIGLFTSRVVLQALGVDDYGTYQVIYSAVMMFTVLSNGISGSISRFLSFELGKGEPGRLKKVFSSALCIQLLLCLILFTLAETLGLWYVKNKISIPEGRIPAAMCVYQTAVISLAIQLMSIPYNCIIIAYEDMKAYAWVSILEGSLKLAVALVLFLTSSDKLKVYSFLLLSVSIIIRGTYTIFCKRHYKETCGRARPDNQLIKQMLSLGVWSFTAHGVGVFNTQGINLLSNSYFGVQINAVRGIAGQVESIVRQFVSNFLTALNPLIIKTWAKGDRDYCFSLVMKGCKFCFLIVLLFVVPFIFESDFILEIWLNEVPDGTPLFTCLATICVMLDFMSNSLAQLLLANGKIGKFYLVTSLISSLTFIGTLTAFRCGANPESAYYISGTVLITISLIRLGFTRHLCQFPVSQFIKEVIVKLVITAVLSIASVYLFSKAFTFDSILMHCLRIIMALMSVGLFSYFIILTEGEKEYFLNELYSILKRKR